MPLDFIIAGALSLLLSLAVLLSRQLRYRRLLAVGLALLGLERLASGWTLGAIAPSDVLFREHIRFLLTALLPGVWILFSRLYGRVQLDGAGMKGLPTAVGSSALALLLLELPVGNFFGDTPLVDPGSGHWLIPLGIRGYLLHILLIVAFTFVVANLERTLRASIGRVRWQIKFAVLGLGGFFAVRIYTASQAVLFRVWSTDLDRLQAWVLIAAVLLTALALRRGGLFEVDVYVSQSALRGSIAVVVVGAYLVGVGVAVHFLRLIGWSTEIGNALVFIAVLAVLAVVLSERTKQDLRRWTRTHFRRPNHEYRLLWTQFNRGTAGHFDEGSIARTVVGIVADSLACLSVSLWAVDAGGGRLRLLASTGKRHGAPQPPELGEEFRVPSSGFRVFLSAPGIWNRESGSAERGSGFQVPGPEFRVPSSGSRTSVPACPADEAAATGTEEGSEEPAQRARVEVQRSRFNVPGSTTEASEPRNHGTTEPETRDPEPGTWNSEVETRNSSDGPEYSIPLRVKDELLGVLTLGERVRGKPLTYEDEELLEVLTEQTSAFLMNIRLGRRLQEASEMQAFQNMSAFFLHDLKNLASRLSLTVSNFPKYYDNPEFREEALKTMSQSVEKIRGMCSRLSLIREKPEVQLKKESLTEFVEGVLAELHPQVGDVLEARLGPVPDVRLDAGQFKKVVVNLVLNAVESSRTSVPACPADEDSAISTEEGAPEPPVERSTFEVAEGEEKAEGRRQKAEEGIQEPGDRRQDQKLGTRNSKPDSRFPFPDSRLPTRNPVYVSTAVSGEHVVLEVRDQGCGMSREFMEERLFHPFQTTKKDGMGIGLFQTRMIVEQHGGRIEAESREGEGSTFRVYLPMGEA